MDGFVAKKAADVLAMMGDGTRIQILWWLDRGERNVTALCSEVGRRQQAVSHHLTILKLRGLVRMDRRGRSNYYSLTDAGRGLIRGSLGAVA